jgi:AcrR family transcriptional regulator
MPYTANDLFAPGAGPGGAWGMTVLELALFMGVFRARRAPEIAELARVVSGWFEQPIAPETAAEPIAHMVASRWLAVEGDRLVATGEGRAAARPLVAGIIRMIDHGTRLVDVALMMTVLRLGQGELDDAPDGQ